MPPVTSIVAIDDPFLRRRWMAQARTGDDTAFRRIFDFHSVAVLRTAQRLLLNRADAEDAAQEVFVRLFRFQERVDAERDLGPWLYRLTVNACQDIRRKRRPSVSLDMDLNLPAPEVDAFQKVEQSERQRALWQALGILSEREREAIVLRDLEGLSTAEVAAALEVRESTIRSQIAMGRAKLRRFLEEQRGRCS